MRKVIIGFVMVVVYVGYLNLIGYPKELTIKKEFNMKDARKTKFCLFCKLISFQIEC